MSALVNARVGLQQRVLPSYRIAFFDTLAQTCSGGLQVFAGKARRAEMIDEGIRPGIAEYAAARNRHLSLGRGYLCWQSGLLPWLESWQPQALILEANPRTLSTLLALRWCRQHNVPAIGWGLGSGAQSGFGAALRRNFHNQFSALIAYSAQGAQDFIRLGFNPARVFTAPNAVAPRPIGDAPQRPGVFRNNRAMVLYVGRLQARKKVDELIRACALLPTYIDVQLDIVGDGPERLTLETLAQTVFPLAKFHGARHGTDLDLLFQHADIFVLPGTGGLAIQQAMSHALPVIVGEADGTQADLVRPTSGWSVSGGEQALANTLQIALSDISRLRRMGLEAFRIVKEEINLENMAAAFVAALHAALEDAHARHPGR